MKNIKISNSIKNYIINLNIKLETNSNVIKKFEYFRLFEAPKSLNPPIDADGEHVSPACEHVSIPAQFRQNSKHPFVSEHFEIEQIPLLQVGVIEQIVSHWVWALETNKKFKINKAKI